MPTIPLGSSGDVGGGVPAVEFNLLTDVQDRITQLQCINRSMSACWASITQDSNGRTAGMRFPPSDGPAENPVPKETLITIGTGVAVRIRAILDSRNRITDLSKEIIWPYA